MGALEIAQELRDKIEKLSNLLYDTNNDYCPEKAGFEVEYKNLKYCETTDCKKCWMEAIKNGL